MGNFEGRVGPFQSIETVSGAKTAEPTKMPLGTWTRGWAQESIIRGGAHWHNLANTTEPFMCDGDAALR